MKAIARFVLLAFAWFFILCIGAIGAPQYVHLTGALADTSEPRHLVDDSVVSIAYTMPRASPSVQPPQRLQSVLPVATVRLTVQGSAAADEWLTFMGFEAWWSLGSPSTSPDDAHAWGSSIKGYSYGEAGSSNYFGTGMISTLNSTRMIDPTKTRELRAFVGQGNVTLFLNLRRVVHEFASGHWSHDFTISVEPSIPSMSITMRYAEPGDTVFAYETGAWGPSEWSWSSEKVHMPTEPGTSSIAFPVAESSVARIESPALAGANYYNVSVQMEARTYCTNGVENMNGDNAVCGGNAIIFGVVTADHFAEPQPTTGYAVGVGSMQVGLLGHDGETDWRGVSGEWNASDGYSSYVLDWLHTNGPQANALAADGFHGDMRVQSQATFIPENQASRIAWAAQVAMRARTRLLGSKIAPVN